MIFNHMMCIFIVITCLIVSIKEYINGTIDKLLLKAIFSYAVFYILPIRFIAQKYIVDLSIFINATLRFLRYIHGEKKIKS